MDQGLILENEDYLARSGCRHAPFRGRRRFSGPEMTRESGVIGARSDCCVSGLHLRSACLASYLSCANFSARVDSRIGTVLRNLDCIFGIVEAITMERPSPLPLSGYSGKTACIICVSDFR